MERRGILVYRPKLDPIITLLTLLTMYIDIRPNEAAGALSLPTAFDINTLAPSQATSINIGSEQSSNRSSMQAPPTPDILEVPAHRATTIKDIRRNNSVHGVLVNVPDPQDSVRK